MDTKELEGYEYIEQILKNNSITDDQKMGQLYWLMTYHESSETFNPNTDISILTDEQLQLLMSRMYQYRQGYYANGIFILGGNAARSIVTINKIKEKYIRVNVILESCVKFMRDYMKNCRKEE